MFELKENPILWPLSANSWSREELAAAISTLLSERVTMGGRVREFETAFARMHNRRWAVMVNSGSSANLIATAAMFHMGKFQRGDEAIVPAVAWSTTYAPLHQYGLKLRVVDVNLKSLNVDVEKIEAAVTEKTRVLVGVSILGNPAALHEMRQIATRHGLAFLEDNCESLGASVEDTDFYNRLTGTFGDASTFSFFFSHHINTVEGGMILTDDDDLADTAICLRAHGWTRDLRPNSPLRRFSPRNGFSMDYEFVLPGYNVRPTEISAALGLAQLGRLKEMNQQRINNTRDFIRAFMRDDRFVLQDLQRGAVPFGFTLICQSEEARELFVGRLAAAGIESRMITGGNFALHLAEEHYEWQAVGELKNAELAHTRGFFLGNHPFPLTEQIAAAKAALGQP